MDIHLLEIFIQAAREGSISKTAKKLNYAQSNVTNKVQQLEAELQTTLFYRHKKGITLTPSGEVLVSYTEKILNMMDEARAAVGNASIPSGPLTIGSMETTAAVRLPTVIAKYHLKYPAVDFSLITGPTEKLVQAVLHYELHGAFVSGPIQHPDLSQEKVFEETLVLVTSPTHPWVDSIHELQNHTMLVFPKGCTYRAKLNSVLQDEGLLPAKLMEFGTLETILACVSAGLGITLLPYSIIADYEDRGKVISHPLPAKLSSVTTMFVKRKDTLTTPALSAFLVEVNNNLSEKLH
ncbi:DNA-binding transcriptional regulator, LysR family [Paenibacillus sp. CF095]|uniref:LysR family transcriptional regulator n=1 Tax=unclassified Paenibacillus TaxID=185978 RepID=UPI000884AD6C|nr:MULTISPECIES: LysR family transcriptional regulator [unclassified Paenibacillus]WJM05769.1 LysR family transcriptional regulator [Paenibacillus sp. PK1-4R]SDC55958.1 DNA-binding transcriptional regulator, LysR family [Paenibacillus sp. CF095]